MRNKRWIIVLDVETDGVDPETCNVVQLAAVPIDPETLEIKERQSFNIDIKPPDIDDDSYFTPEIEKTIAWHAKNYNTSSDKIISKWKSATPEHIAWKSFCDYCDKFNIEKQVGSWHTEPIPAGYNIVCFDLPILKRISKKYKTKFPLSTLQKLDMYDNIFWWFESLDQPANYKLDTLREFFGLDVHSTAHDALSDVIDEAKIITRFLGFHRKQASVSKFKGSFSK